MESSTKKRVLSPEKKQAIQKQKEARQILVKLPLEIAKEIWKFEIAHVHKEIKLKLLNHIFHHEYEDAKRDTLKGRTRSSSNSNSTSASDVSLIHAATTAVNLSLAWMGRQTLNPPETITEYSDDEDEWIPDMHIFRTGRTPWPSEANRIADEMDSSRQIMVTNDIPSITVFRNPEADISFKEAIRRARVAPRIEFDTPATTATPTSNSNPMPTIKRSDTLNTGGMIFGVSPIDFFKGKATQFPTGLQLELNCGNIWDHIERNIGKALLKHQGITKLTDIFRKKYGGCMKLFSTAKHRHPHEKCRVNPCELNPCKLKSCKEKPCKWKPCELKHHYQWVQTNQEYRRCLPNITPPNTLYNIRSTTVPNSPKAPSKKRIKEEQLRIHYVNLYYPVYSKGVDIKYHRIWGDNMFW